MDYVNEICIDGSVKLIYAELNASVILNSLEIFRAGICAICALFNKTDTHVMHHLPDNSVNGFIVLAQNAENSRKLMGIVRRK